jgi:glucosamine-6-phosphate deaminase
MSDPIRSFATDALTVRVYTTATALSRAAAAEVHEFLKERIARAGEARVILATGNSQLQFLEDLSRLGGVDWSRVTCFHMDEYLGLGAEHPGSFIRYLHERVESRVKPGEFHFLRGDTADAAAECARYEALLQDRPIDLCCLGIGDNGHLAFNDPGVADFNDPHWVKVVPLDEMNRKQQFGYGCFKKMDEVPREGITLTIPALVSARKIVALALGKRKADIIERALRGPISTDCPATCLRNQSQAVLLLDEGAAQNL